MAYVEETDYSRLITHNDLTDILEEASGDYSGKSYETVRTDAEAMAQSRINLYLRDRYDMSSEFALTPSDDRDEVILYCYLTLAVYFMHITLSARDVPAVRKQEYNSCMKTLEKIRDGEIRIDLEPEDETFGSVLISGNGKFISKPFEGKENVNSSVNPHNL